MPRTQLYGPRAACRVQLVASQCSKVGLSPLVNDTDPAPVRGQFARSKFRRSWSLFVPDDSDPPGSARATAKQILRVVFSVVSRAPAPDLAPPGRGQHRCSALLLAHGPVPWIGGTDRRRPGRKASLLRAAAGPESWPPMACPDRIGGGGVA